MTVAPGTSLGSLLLSDCATEPSCCRLFFFFLTFSVMYFTLYRVFSSFHQHSFVSLSLSLCADVTGFVTEKTDGARDTHTKKNTNTYFVRTEWRGVPLAWLSVPLYFFILFFSSFGFIYLFIYFILSLLSLISSFLSTILSVIFLFLSYSPSFFRHSFFALRHFPFTSSASFSS